jgi:hypothetical protein
MVPFSVVDSFEDSFTLSKEGVSSDSIIPRFHGVHLYEGRGKGLQVKCSDVCLSSATKDFRLVIKKN